MDITLRPGVWIEPTKYFEKIADAGYAARKEDTLLTLTGTIAKEVDQLIFTVSNVGSSPVKLQLFARKTKDEAETSRSEAALKSAGELVGKPVEVEGWWRPADKKVRESLPTLAVVKCRNEEKEKTP